MITLVENAISIDEYLYLREQVGWAQLSDRQAQLALENCLYNIKAVDDNGYILGMGRIVGDGAVICYIQDLVVIPEAQGKGVGSLIIDALIDYAKAIKEEGTTMMLCLMCAKGREPFYEKHKFISRPTDSLGPGMIQYL
ncbi:MAG: GNAT family N-acetyltransferase [Lachnospiraceae bacterium]|nr:GNAT family N-acetyltransferase [Lachnospiraceae bacterium]